MFYTFAKQRCYPKQARILENITMAQMNDKALEELTVVYGERPSMEPLEGVTGEHRRAGSHLAAIHRMHLRDVYYIGKLLEQVKCFGPLKLCQYLLTNGVAKNGTETVFG